MTVQRAAWKPQGDERMIAFADPAMLREAQENAGSGANAADASGGADGGGGRTPSCNDTDRRELRCPGEREEAQRTGLRHRSTRTHGKHTERNRKHPDRSTQGQTRTQDAALFSRES